MAGPDNVIVEYTIDPTAPLVDGAQLYVRDSILFEVEGTAPREEGLAVLDIGVLLMQQNPQMIVEIGGHTDSSGDAEWNLRLSEDRAQSIADYLTAAGIDPSRFVIRAYGETQPVADNSTSEGRAANPRVELAVYNLLG